MTFIELWYLNICCFYHIWLSCSGSFGLYEWICHLLYVRGCSHCHSWIAVKGLVMQPFGHARVLEWKKKKKRKKLNWVRIYVTRQRSEASVQDEGSELSSVELVHLMFVLTEIHLTLNLVAHYIVLPLLWNYFSGNASLWNQRN